MGGRRGLGRAAARFVASLWTVQAPPTACSRRLGVETGPPQSSNTGSKPLQWLVDTPPINPASPKKPTRFVSDLIQGMVAVMDGEHAGPFNIGNPGEFTMLELAEVVREVVNPE